jgi:hypothetical protein
MSRDLPAMSQARLSAVAPWREKRVGLAVTWIGLCVVCVIAARSINYVSAVRPGPDAGVYAVWGMMLADGEVPYKDIATDKPPVVFALNAFALSLGDGSFHSIRLLERLVAVIDAVLFFLIIQVLFRRTTLSLLATIAFLQLFFLPSTFEQGNTTEEFAVSFVLAGILCAVRAGHRTLRPGLGLALASGLFFSCAVLAKEPFVLSSFAWFLYIVLKPGDGWRPTVLFRRGGSFLVGALLPGLGFVLYLFMSGGFSDWADHIYYVMNYYVPLSAQHAPENLAGQTPFGRAIDLILLSSHAGRLAFATLLVAVAAFPGFLRRHGYLPLLVLLGLFLDYLGSTTSSRLYGHYYTQMIPSYVICCAFGGAFLMDTLEAAFGFKWRRFAVLAVVVIAFLDHSTIAGYWDRLSQPFEHAGVGDLSGYVKAQAEEGDTLWVADVASSRFYVETGLRSPTKYCSVFPLWFVDTPESTEDAKVQRLLSELERGSPAWIVTGGPGTVATEFLQATTFEGWFLANYTMVPETSDSGYGSRGYLHVRNDRRAE